MNPTEEIQVTFQNMKAIYHDTRLLLDEVGVRLKKEGFEVFRGNEIVAPSSLSIKTPDQWILPCAIRRYVKRTGEQHVKAVGVFFLDNDFEIIEPLVVFGLYHQNGPEHADVLRLAWSAAEKGGRKEEWITMKNIRISSTKSFDAKIRAVNLGAVQSSRELIEKVADPLLKVTFDS